MRSLRRRRGFSLIQGTILGLAFIAVMGLAIDTAYVVLCEHQLQNAADAAALAGAFNVRTSQNTAMSLAQSTAAANFCANQSVVLANNSANSPNGDVVVGRYYRPGDPSGKLGFFSTDTPLNAVMVTARRTTGSAHGPVPLFFGRMFQINNCEMTRTATAVIGGTISAGVVILNRHAPGSFAMTGKGSRPKVIINLVQDPGAFGAMIVNSDDPNGMTWTTSNAIVDVGNLYLGGNEPSGQALVPDGTVHIKSPPVDDPLANVPAPAQPVNSGNMGKQVGGVWQAGYYKSGLSGTLGPGVFWVDGGVTGQITATQGTMLYVNSGGIALQGNRGITINPPTSGTYAGISIFQARTNTTGMTMQGTPDINNTGVLYLPAANMAVAGNPSAVGSMLVVDTLSVQGNGTVNINYDGAFPVEGNSIFLVQ
jgi:Flp pilus assembly protein TadG